MIEKTLVSQLDDSTSCLDESLLNDITIIVEEQNESCLSDTANPTHCSVGICENQTRESRKRVRDESTWKRNILKYKKNTGQHYETRLSKMVVA